MHCIFTKKTEMDICTVLYTHVLYQIQQDYILPCWVFHMQVHFFAYYMGSQIHVTILCIQTSNTLFNCVQQVSISKSEIKKKENLAVFLLHHKWPSLSYFGWGRSRGLKAHMWQRTPCQYNCATRICGDSIMPPLSQTPWNKWHITM